MERVGTLTRSAPSELSVAELKSLLYVLANYLSLAPCEEDERSLVPFARQLRKELQVRVTSAQIFEQPPEIGFS